MRDPILAGILSLIVPGLGQFYNGRILAGIMWLFLAIFVWGWTWGLFGWVFHLISAYCAYSYAKEHRIRV